ncbi:MAG: C-terminal helicase domain-containing protein, partial [Candidatus Margulisiibacteriota bacterium]
IFSQFVRMLTIMQTWLDAMGVPYEILTGQTKDRQGVVNRFNEDARIRIILVSLKAGGTGINLTAADYVFHYDPWWNPAVENQAPDRVHRIGQNKPVFVYKMLTKNTVEDKIYQIQFQKKAVYQQLLNESAGFSPILKAEDVDYLLQDYTD